MDEGIPAKAFDTHIMLPKFNSSKWLRETSRKSAGRVQLGGIVRLGLGPEIFGRVGMAILVRASIDQGLGFEIPVPRRTRRGPFERVGSPRVAAGPFAKKQTSEEVHRKDQLSGAHQHCRIGNEDVDVLKPFEALVDIRSRIATRHPAQKVHWEEGAIQKNECQEKVQLAQRFVHRPAKHFGEPEVDRSEDAQNAAAEKHVVQMSHNVVRVVNHDVDWRS